MKHLENYYRNLCEQLQQQLNILEAKMNEKKKAKNKGKKDSKKEKMADKDYDGDGKIESSKDEYFGSKDKAIKKKMAEKKKVIKEGREIHGGIMNYGGFPRVINENGVTQAFQDSPSDGQVNVATRTNNEEDYISEKDYFAGVQSTTDEMAKLRKSSLSKEEKLKAHSVLQDKLNSLRSRRRPAKPSSGSDYGSYGSNTNIDSSREGT
jgi:CubicO group peptidase (beta-lactamase class C family)